MGLDFSKTPVQTQTAAAPAVPDVVEEVKTYDIVADRRQELNQELVNSQEVDALVSTIEINNIWRRSLLSVPEPPGRIFQGFRRSTEQPEYVSAG